MTGLVIATSMIDGIKVNANGNFYWCDGVIFLAAFLLDPLAAFITGGIGTMIYDLLTPRAYNCIASLIIHGLQAAVVSVLVHYVFPRKNKKLEPLWAGISSVIGGALVVLGYFIQRYYILKLDNLVIGEKAIANVVQEIIGISIAMVICYATTFKKQLEKAHLLPDFTGEMLQKKQPAPTEEPPAEEQPKQN